MYRIRNNFANPIPIKVKIIEPRSQKRMESKKDQLDELRPLPTVTINRLRDEILIEWIYNSNANEGSTISLQKTRLILYKISPWALER
jgi:hypothetical protein